MKWRPLCQCSWMLVLNSFSPHRFFNPHIECYNTYFCFISFVFYFIMKWRPLCQCSWSLRPKEYGEDLRLQYRALHRWRCVQGFVIFMVVWHRAHYFLAFFRNFSLPSKLISRDFWRSSQFISISFLVMVLFLLRLTAFFEACIITMGLWFPVAGWWRCTCPPGWRNREKETPSCGMY